MNPGGGTSSPGAGKRAPSSGCCFRSGGDAPARKACIASASRLRCSAKAASTCLPAAALSPPTSKHAACARRRAAASSACRSSEKSQPQRGQVAASVRRARHAGQRSRCSGIKVIEEIGQRIGRRFQLVRGSAKAILDRLDGVHQVLGIFGGRRGQQALGFFD
jgi:hypothetical protein